MKFPVTTHTIVKNEDRWIWYTLMSVIDQVDRLLVYDTGSTDKTIDIIRSINSPKIIFEKKQAVNRKDISQLRQEQLDKTKTEWFMLLDGDEIWPKKNLTKLLSQTQKASTKTLAFFNHTRNCVGDIYHYQPDSKGRYRIKNKTGHLNIRLMRTEPNLKVVGEYPLEAYTLAGTPIQQLEDQIEYVNTWYLHTTHLPRSTNKQAEKAVIDRDKKRKFRLGNKMTQAELPQVLFAARPSIVPAPVTKPWQYFSPPK